MSETVALFLITGVMAAGKSTVAQALAKRLLKSVHLRGDVLPQEDRFRADGDDGRTLSRGGGATRAALPARGGVARGYLEAGFTVVYQDIIVGASLTEVLGLLPVPPVLVVLCPSAEVIAARDAERTKTGYSEAFTAAGFDRVLRDETPRLGLWLDTSTLGVAATVEATLAYADEHLA